MLAKVAIDKVLGNICGNGTMLIKTNHNIMARNVLLNYEPVSHMPDKNILRVNLKLQETVLKHSRAGTFYLRELSLKLPVGNVFSGVGYISGRNRKCSRNGSTC